MADKKVTPKEPKAKAKARTPKTRLQPKKRVAMKKPAK